MISIPQLLCLMFGHRRLWRQNILQRTMSPRLIPFDEWMNRPEDEAAQGATQVAAPKERKVPERGKDEPEGAGRDSLSEPENKRRKVADPPFERDSTGVPSTPRKTTASSTAPTSPIMPAAQPYKDVDDGAVEEPAEKDEDIDDADSFDLLLEDVSKCDFFDDKEKSGEKFERFLERLDDIAEDFLADRPQGRAQTADPEPPVQQPERRKSSDPRKEALVKELQEAAKTGVFDLHDSKVGQAWGRDLRSQPDLRARYKAVGKEKGDQARFRADWADKRWRPKDTSKIKRESYTQIDERIGRFMPLASIYEKQGGESSVLHFKVKALVSSIHIVQENVSRPGFWMFNTQSKQHDWLLLTEEWRQRWQEDWTLEFAEGMLNSSSSSAQSSAAVEQPAGKARAKAKAKAKAKGKATRGSPRTDGQGTQATKEQKEMQQQVQTITALLQQNGEIKTSCSNALSSYEALKRDMTADAWWDWAKKGDGCLMEDFFANVCEPSLSAWLVT